MELPLPLQRQLLYQKYHDLFLSEDTKERKKEQRDIKKMIDGMSYDENEEDEEEFASYPSHNDPKFIDKISEKAEFRHQKNLFDEKNLENECSPTEFELGKHQEFLRNFVNETTPYKGILVFHGVGVGKTCSAITISQSFRDIYRRKQKKIICLVSETIKPGWMNQIYDPTKGPNQCSGESFHSLVSRIDTNLEDTDQKKKNKTKKLINEFYDFYGYGKFSNMVSTLIKRSIGNRNLSEKERQHREKKCIQSYFSDRLLIIDEVQNIRDEKETKSRDILINLYKVIKYSRNLRLVLLSATPLFNQPTEITWILNMLLKNDNRPTIRDREIFSNQGKLTEQGKNILSQKSRGYVSYLRGENPVSFPIRLYPDSNDDPNCIPNDIYPKRDIWNQPIQHTSFLRIYKTEFGINQKQVYQAYINSLKYSSNLSPIEIGTGIQMANMVYPVLGNKTTDQIIPKDMYGDRGIQTIMDTSIQQNRRIYKYKPSYLEEYDVPCFDSSSLADYSGKIDAIVKGIQKSKGIVFIYSQYKSSGLVPLALALEHAGYGKYGDNDLWDHKGNESFRKKPINSSGKKTTASKQAKYIILSGDLELSPNNESEIKELVSERNKEGDMIKIILGSKVTSEGLDFKNIREIHILEPWFHIFRLEQIIGRGIRRCSHKDLPKEDRNVTIYQHVGYITKDSETIDFQTYRLAEKKAIDIGEIETILKENAVDCILNKGSNIIQKTDVQPRKLITSRGTNIPSFDVSDKPMTKICSYQEDCNYKCSGDGKVSKTNYDTFSRENSTRIIQTIQKTLQEMFSLDNYYSLEEIDEVVSNILDSNSRIIYMAIDDMIRNRIPLWNSTGMEGYIINRGNYYMFQPINNTDPLLPLYYRHTSGSIQPENSLKITDVFNWSEVGVEKKEVEKKEVEKKDDTTIIEKLYKEIFFVELDSSETSFQFQGKKYDFHEIIELDAELILSHKLDSLDYKKKIQLLKHILLSRITCTDMVQKFTSMVQPEYNKKIHFRQELTKISKNRDKANAMILHHFRYNLIKKNKNQYFICSEEDYEVSGFFIHNTDTFHKKKNKGKELDQILNDYDYYLCHDDEWNNINDMSNGKVILKKIEKNFHKESFPMFQNIHTFWGFSFKSRDHKHVLKLSLSEGFGVRNKIPGLILNDTPNHKNIMKVLEGLFPEEYLKYESLITPENKKHYKSKLFLCLLMEMILRKHDKDNPQRTYYISYDIFLLKFI